MTPGCGSWAAWRRDWPSRPPRMRRSSRTPCLATHSSSAWTPCTSCRRCARDRPRTPPPQRRPSTARAALSEQDGSVLPERLRQPAPLRSRVGMGEVLHALGREPPGPAGERLERYLEAHRAGQRQVSALIEGELGPPDGDRVLRRHHLDERPDLAVEVLGRADPVDQVVPLRGLGIEELADEVPFLSLAPAGEAGQPRHAAPARRDVPVDLGHSPPGAVGGDHEVADQGQLQAAARAHAVDGRDGDCGEVLDGLGGFLVLPRLVIRVLIGPGQEVLDVIAGAERLAGAADDEEAALPVLLHRAHGVGELVGHLAVQGVVRLRPVEGDSRDRALAADLAAVLERRHDYRHEIEELLERGAAEGRFSVDNAKVAAFAIIEMCEAVPKWFRPDGDLSDERVAYLYGEFAVRLASSMRTSA